VNFRHEKVLAAFGKNLQGIRKANQFTQEELAFQSGVSLFQIV
jgi:DNA-binding XRE family transcriptional regulator